MNKSIFIFLVAIIYMAYTKNASAQYKSVFGDSNTSWTVTHCYSYNHGADFTDSFYVSGDTFAFNQFYYKINLKQLNYDPAFYCLMREDSSIGKVWMRWKNNLDLEYLIMDVSLQEGDSFPFYNSKGGLAKYEKVVRVHEWPYGSSTMKRIEFDYELNCNTFMRQNFAFLEGVGINAGLHNFSYFMQNDDVQLTCYFKDGVRYYFLPVFGSNTCNYYDNYWNVEENNAFTYFNIYPNPIKNTGTISFSNDERSNINFSIYDVSGKCLYQTQCRENQIQFTTENLKQGIYLYKLQSENGKQASGKFIKN